MPLFLSISPLHWSAWLRQIGLWHCHFFFKVVWPYLDATANYVEIWNIKVWLLEKCTVAEVMVPLTTQLWEPLTITAHQKKNRELESDILIVFLILALLLVISVFLKSNMIYIFLKTGILSKSKTLRSLLKYLPASHNQELQISITIIWMLTFVPFRQNDVALCLHQYVF